MMLDDAEGSTSFVVRVLSSHHDFALRFLETTSSWLRDDRTLDEVARNLITMWSCFLESNAGLSLFELGDVEKSLLAPSLITACRRQMCSSQPCEAEFFVANAFACLV